MTREEIYSMMYDDEEVYRSPLESESALLEVTHGCSYGGCLFCDFRRDDYREYPLDKIEQRIRLLSMVIDGNERLYFLGCNPLCMPTGYLMKVLSLVHTWLPSVKTVSMYARADDILRKGPDDLRLLRSAGVTELHVGLESGSDRILKLHNKGETAGEIEQALHMLTACGMFYHLTMIPGLGGRELSDEHAEKTAELLSRLQPVSVWCIGLKIWPDTPLFHMVEQGTFHPMDWLSILKEERKMLSLTDMSSECLYIDSTVLGKYTIVMRLPDGKEATLEKIDRLIEQSP